MSGFELVAGVIAVFFAAGVAVGVLLVAVLPRFRRLTDCERDGRGYTGGGGRLRMPPPYQDEKPPWWQDG